eukprot:TRINITY_DN114130_c0_g1_i1.p2 TRINITY_DN114130_c0_g1~~TRINITY_DN114130_c0_g1_i1.p2  ORF type:complete len:367 (-),score=92.91 TRINITY_DN114130_c0_g1_i1:34-1134(-)
MNKAKAMLDALMGPARDLSAKDKTGEEFKNSDVCKVYLVAGFCPDHILGKKGVWDGHETCHLLHSPAMRTELDAHPQAKKYRTDYETQAIKRLEDMVAEVEARGFAWRRKCRPPETMLYLNEDLQKRLDLWEQEHVQLMRVASAKGESGDISGSQAAAKQAGQRAEMIQQLKDDNTFDFPGEDVCEACGIKYLKAKKRILSDEEASAFKKQPDDIWQDEHFSSKAHDCFMKIRDALAELKASQRKREEDKKKGDDERKNGKRGSEERKSRSKDRKSKSKDRKSKSKDRKSKSRDKKSKSRSKSKARSRSAKKKSGRDRSRSRRRSRDRKSRERDRDRRDRGRRDRSRSRSRRGGDRRRDRSRSRRR